MFLHGAIQRQRHRRLGQLVGQLVGVSADVRDLGNQRLELPARIRVDRNRELLSAGSQQDLPGMRSELAETFQELCPAGGVVLVFRFAAAFGTP